MSRKNKEQKKNKRCSQYDHNALIPELPTLEILNLTILVESSLLIINMFVGLVSKSIENAYMTNRAPPWET